MIRTTVAKRKEKRAKSVAVFLATITFSLFMLLACAITYSGGVREGFAALIGVIFGYTGGITGLTVYYAVYEKRRYKI